MTLLNSGYGRAENIPPHNILLAQDINKGGKKLTKPRVHLQTFSLTIFGCIRESVGKDYEEIKPVISCSQSN